MKTSGSRVTSHERSGFLGFGRTNKVYLSESAFSSRNQLYTVMHHEYMHSYFYSNAIKFTGLNEERVINQWEYNQAQAWGWKGEYDPKLKSGLDGIHYSNYGFKIIKNKP
ncbi:hypothetical protein [Flavobacterium sp. CLA17]|uniref:hypothetical protein n=1 Tax=Flavobacterium sp. CLA17 TaxID=2724135 RepID=UPI001491499B|nr:hypothetical protein [Flavobacterium sp. CLA17]QSB25546.1 hypothetical protein HAV12_014320 [Flavobacterium sp. CLA17]